ncbi:hypothetical protein SAMD00023519_00241 [Listeria monocytogenes]|nr:hypothetical protein SAMD00023519_00241 [Listeria monocytogenes]
MYFVKICIIKRSYQTKIASFLLTIFTNKEKCCDCADTLNDEENRNDKDDTNCGNNWIE